MSEAQKGNKHNQGKTLSAETRRKISEAQKGKPKAKHSEEFKQKISKIHKGNTYRLGQKASAATRQRMSKSRSGDKNPRGMLGKHHSEESKLKIGKASEGNKHGVGHRHFGIRPSAESRRKMSEAAKGNRNHLGHKHSAAARLKMSASHRGQIAWNKGKQVSEESRKRMIAAARKWRKNA